MSQHTLPIAAAALITAIALGTPPPASAQGNGRPKGPRSGSTGAPAPSPSSGTTATITPDGTFTSAPVMAFPQFGAWLDDASASGRGDAVVSIGAGHWRLAGMTQTNLPMIGAGVGVTDRLQVSASVPFYRATASTWSARGLDDVYVSAKYTVVDPTLSVSEVGVAFSPVVEILSAGAADGRVHFALPMNVEWRRLPFRVYGSGGYFTRGAVFAGGAVEWNARSGVSVTGSLLQSYSVKTPDPTLAALGRQHVDASIGAAAPVGRSASVYGSVGRSLTSVEAGGASLAVTGGIAIRFSAATAIP